MQPIVLLLPGQGSQKVGMGRDLADAFPVARDVFAEVDAALEAPLSRLMWDGPGDDLTLTSNAQPALLAHSAAVWAVLRDALGAHVRAAAGHSLGEFSAYHVAGSLALRDAVRLVRRRGALMLDAGAKHPGTMAAILGTLTESIDSICARASAEAGLVVPANYNAAEQVVISGERSGVDLAMELCKAAGAKRAVPLSVSGAFHSPLMATAADGLAESLATVAFAAPQVPVYACVDGKPVTEVAHARRALLAQLTSSVQWTTLVANLAAAYPDALFVEVGTGSVLTGLVKRIAPQVATATCGTAAEVDALLARAASPVG
ncbi:MAG: ACP S-malonyltransferase [Gemmatimonadaceae bacterium]|nr:ACP S-malonyltransferase [Gemmatimonadaceae bacterium]